MIINNYNDFLSYLDKISEKKKLLLHACCGPCSSHTISLLEKYFDITIFYSNDNIYPKTEYDLRLKEQTKFINAYSKDIKLLYDDYNDKDFYEAIKGFEDLDEKSIRCFHCYRLRLEKTAFKAKELGFDYFTTTLSISPHKNSDWINEIGYKLENKYDVKYLYSNFKKADGYKKSIDLANKYNLYRQEYCGCIFSYNKLKKD